MFSIAPANQEQEIPAAEVREEFRGPQMVSMSLCCEFTEGLSLRCQPFFSKISWWQLLSPTDTMPQRRPVERGKERDLRFEGLKDVETCCFCHLFGEFLGEHEGNLLRKCCWCCVGFAAFAGHSIPCHSFSKAHCEAFVQMIDFQAVLLAISINLYVRTSINSHIFLGDDHP